MAPTNFFQPNHSVLHELIERPRQGGPFCAPDLMLAHFDRAEKHSESSAALDTNPLQLLIKSRELRVSLGPMVVLLQLRHVKH